MRAYYFPGVPIVDTGTGTGNGTTTVVADKNYRHFQTTPSKTWTVFHNLGKTPAVTVMDSAGTKVMGGEQHIDLNTTVLTFSAAFSGEASFN
jgi:hypothetical protein